MNRFKFLVLSLSLVATPNAFAQSPVSQRLAEVNILTDAAGRTLYTFDQDGANVSNCTGDCLVEWPAFVPTPADTAVGADLPGLELFARADGTKQYSLKGKPLYFFDQDVKPGDALGSEDDGLFHVVALVPPKAPETPFQVVSGCQATDYVDGTAGPLIQTGAGIYTPKCLRVHVGAKISITGSKMHPLQAQAAVLGLANPFLTAAGSTGVITQALTSPGFYGYYCIHHGTPQGGGMAGSIQVVP